MINHLPYTGDQLSDQLKVFQGWVSPPQGILKDYDGTGSARKPPLSGGKARSWTGSHCNLASGQSCSCQSLCRGVECPHRTTLLWYKDFMLKSLLWGALSFSSWWLKSFITSGKSPTTTRPSTSCVGGEIPLIFLHSLDEVVCTLFSFHFSLHIRFALILLNLVKSCFFPGKRKRKCKYIF